MNISIAQLEATVGDKQANLKTIERTMEQASEDHADLIVYPELFLTGYLLHSKVDSLAEPSTGASIRKIQHWCKEYNIHAVVGFPEKDMINRHIYISSALIDHHGQLIGIYRKTHLFEEEKKYFSVGNDFQVIETAFGKVGLMICFDIEFPEIARSLKLKGAEMFIVINANMYPYQAYHYIYAKSRAMENEVPLVICNQLGTTEGIEFCGDSMVIDWNGTEILRMKKEEAIKTVNIPSSKNKQFQLDYIQNRREDLYSMDKHKEGMISDEYENRI